MPRPTLVAEEVPPELLGRTRTERVERENAALKARLRELEEDYSGAPDLEGQANLPSVGVLEHKNVPLFWRDLDRLPVICAREGHAAAVRYAQSALALRVTALWLRPSRNGRQEEDRHAVYREFFEEPGVNWLVVPGPQGRLMRRQLERWVLRLPVRGSVELMAERGREAPAVPLGAPRRSPPE